VAERFEGPLIDISTLQVTPRAEFLGLVACLAFGRLLLCHDTMRKSPAAVMHFQLVLSLSPADGEQPRTVRHLKVRTRNYDAHQISAVMTLCARFFSMAGAAARIRPNRNLFVMS